jgi:hypothetical protein
VIGFYDPTRPVRPEMIDAGIWQQSPSRTQESRHVGFGLTAAFPWWR